MITNDLSIKFKPSSMTAYERYETLIPILSDASKAYQRIISEERTAVRDKQLKTRLNTLFRKVAKKGGMSLEEVRRAFVGFTIKGMCGLITPSPISAEEIVANSQGTWELATRYTNGGNTPHVRAKDYKTHARSFIYNEVVSPTEMIEVSTMWNDENHHPRKDAIKKHDMGPNATFLIVAKTRVKISQIDDYTVEYTADSELVGNFGSYKTPGCGHAKVLLMKLDGEPAFASFPEVQMCLMPDGRKIWVVGVFLLLNAGGNQTSRRYTMSGMPALYGDVRTMDVTDHYVKVSHQQPLVGGWERISAHYDRMRNLLVNGYQGEDREELLKYA